MFRVGTPSRKGGPDRPPGIRRNVGVSSGREAVEERSPCATADGKRERCRDAGVTG